MNADNIWIECEEDGFWLYVHVDGEFGQYRITDPEALYDHVKAVIGPWLRERETAKAEYVRNFHNFHCDPDESGGYDTSDPKHPDFHSIHADLYDQREKT